MNVGSVFAASDQEFKQPSSAATHDPFLGPPGLLASTAVAARMTATTISQMAPPFAILTRPYQDHFLDPISSKGRPRFDLSGASIFAADSNKQMSFPLLLYWILEEAVDMGYDHIVSWRPHGRAFVIHDKEALERVVMPRSELQLSCLLVLSMVNLTTIFFIQVLCIQTFLYTPAATFLV